MPTNTVCKQSSEKNETADLADFMENPLEIAVDFWAHLNYNEGVVQFGYILCFRKGLWMKDDTVDELTVFTAGYAGKSARVFFELLRKAGVRKVIDVRLYNTSQLAGFTKRDDLAYFLRAIVGADYVHLPQLAPTKQILNDYKQGVIDWEQYEVGFNDLITARRIETLLTPQRIENACFLCAEAKPAHCHRRLVAEYMANHWPNIEIVHL